MRTCRPRVVVITEDPWVDLPLTEVGPVGGHQYLVPEELGLSRDLTEALDRWQSRAGDPVMLAIADDSRPFVDPRPRDFVPDPARAVEGFRLVARLQRELGAGWIVHHDSDHDFFGPASKPYARALRTLLLTADSGGTWVLDVTDGMRGRKALRLLRSFGASSTAESALAIWRRTAQDGLTADSRADGADVAALIQQELGLAVRIRYEGGDAPTSGA